MKKTSALAASCALAVASVGVEWQSRQPLPEGVAGGAAGSVGSRIIYAGGTTWRDEKKIWLSRAHAYRTDIDVWEDAAPLPEPLAYGAYSVHDGALEVLGGLNEHGASLKCWLLTGAHAQWRQSGSAPVSTALGKAVAIDKQTYLFGGCPDAANLEGCTDAVFVRDAGGQWRRVGKLPGGKVALSAAAVIGADVYLFGGCVLPDVGGLRNLDDGWRFHTLDQSWHKLRSLPSPARSMTAAALSNGQIFLAGGYTASLEERERHGPDYGFSKRTYEYDPESDRYTASATLPVGLAGPELIRSGETVYAAGGEDLARHRSAALFAIKLR